MQKIVQTEAVGQTAPDEKRLANLKAQLALRGFAVHDTVTGGWLVARWDRAHYCPHLIDLEAFARRVGVPDVV